MQLAICAGRFLYDLNRRRPLASAVTTSNGGCYGCYGTASPCSDTAADVAVLYCFTIYVCCRVVAVVVGPTIQTYTHHSRPYHQMVQGAGWDWQRCCCCVALRPQGGQRLGPQHSMQCCGRPLSLLVRAMPAAAICAPPPPSSQAGVARC